MKVSILTSSRADFGLLKNLIHEIKKDKKFSVSVIASGSHFSKKFGETYREIIKDKIKIDQKIVFKSISDDVDGISQIFGKCVEKTTKILKKKTTGHPQPYNNSPNNYPKSKSKSNIFSKPEPKPTKSIQPKNPIRRRWLGRFL